MPIPLILIGGNQSLLVARLRPLAFRELAPPNEHDADRGTRQRDLPVDHRAGDCQPIAMPRGIASADCQTRGSA